MALDCCNSEQVKKNPRQHLHSAGSKSPTVTETSEQRGQWPTKLSWSEIDVERLINRELLCSFLVHDAQRNIAAWRVFEKLLILRASGANRLQLNCFQSPG